eukprot:scaffold1929_cov376-Prasinococcus_capsulatus_cf.AAC.14
MLAASAVSQVFLPRARRPRFSSRVLTERSAGVPCRAVPLACRHKFSSPLSLCPPSSQLCSSLTSKALTQRRIRRVAVRAGTDEKSEAGLDDGKRDGLGKDDKAEGTSFIERVGSALAVSMEPWPVPWGVSARRPRPH